MAEAPKSKEVKKKTVQFSVKNLIKETQHTEN
jgi:hypothetical protein